MRIPIEDLIKEITKFIEEKLSLTGKKKSGSDKVKEINVKMEISQINASLCLFLYAFIVQTFDYYEKNEAVMSYKAINIVTIWKNICKLVRYFYAVRSLYDIDYLYNEI